MPRPDPRKIARRPMARAGREIAFARGRRTGDAESGPLFTEAGELDVDALQQALDAAESVIEGRPYAAEGGEERVFFGSAVLRVPLVTDEGEALVRALSRDARGRRVLQDRVYRELARLLGPHTPDAFEMSHRARVEERREERAVRIDVDIEAPLPGAAKAESS